MLYPLFSCLPSTRVLQRLRPGRDVLQLLPWGSNQEVQEKKVGRAGIMRCHQPLRHLVSWGTRWEQVTFLCDGSGTPCSPAATNTTQLNLGNLGITGMNIKFANKLGNSGREPP